MSGCGTVRVRTYDPPEVDRKEILRYAGVRGELPELDGVLAECLREAAGKLTYRVCWTEFPLSCREGKLDLGFAVTDSASLGRTMERCDTVVRQIELSAQRRGERVAVLEARRHYCWYLKGVPHAGYYKEQIVRMNTLEDVYQVTKGIKRDLR